MTNWGDFSFHHCLTNSWLCSQFCVYFIRILLNSFIIQTNECGLLRISLKIDSNFNHTDFLDTWLDARVNFDQWKKGEWVTLSLSFNTRMCFISSKICIPFKVIKGKRKKKINFLQILFQIYVFKQFFFSLNVITNLWLSAPSRARSFCLV